MAEKPINSYRDPKRDLTPLPDLVRQWIERPDDAEFKTDELRWLLLLLDRARHNVQECLDGRDATPSMELYGLVALIERHGDKLEAAFAHDCECNDDVKQDIEQVLTAINNNKLLPTFGPESPKSKWQVLRESLWLMENFLLKPAVPDDDLSSDLDDER